MNSRPTRLPALDGIRGLAILMVLVYHFSLRLEPSTIAQTVFRHTTGIGWAGVDLFFVLSGFLITGNLYDSRGSATYYRTFYARRVLRIFPLYYLYLAVYYVVLPLLYEGGSLAHAITTLQRHRWWFWTYTSNVLVAWSGDAGPTGPAPMYTGAMWSLAVEEQFYLVWPLFVSLAGRYLARWCVTIVVATLLIRLAALLLVGRLGAELLMPARMDSLALGAWLAVTLRERGAAGLRRFIPRALGISGSALAVIWAAQPTWFDMTSSFVPTIGFSLIAVFFAGVVAASLVRPDGIWRRIGETRWLRWLGAYAYGLYIWHNPVRLLLDALRLNPESLVGAGVNGFVAVTIFGFSGIGLSIACAVLSWHTFEAPILNLKRFVPYASARSQQAMLNDQRVLVANGANLV